MADHLLPKIEPALKQAEHALELSKTVEKDRLQPMLSVLEYQRSLLRIIDQLKKLKADLLVAKPKLAGLINAPMHSNFKLAQPKETPEPPVLTTSMTDLENLGLFYRPELREEMYQERISRDEVWKEMLKILPGLTIPLSGNWDSNSYLVYDMWMEAGVRTTFNLVNLIAAPKIWTSAETQVEVAKTRRKALSVATLVQVNVGYQQYLKALDSYNSASALNKVDQGIFKVISDTTESDAGSELEKIHAATSALASQLEKEQSLAEIYAALGNIYASIGLNPVDGDIENITVRTLAVKLEKTLEHWYKGEFPKLPNTPDTADKKPPPPSVSSTPTTNIVDKKPLPPFTPIPPIAQPVYVSTKEPVIPSEDYYAVQLIASTRQSDVVRFMGKWSDKLSPLIMTDKFKKSKHIFVLVYGTYSSITAARQAIVDLAPELKKNKPWVVQMRGNVLSPRNLSL
jgi:septal ring-binding cell division protein DamX